MIYFDYKYFLMWGRYGYIAWKLWDLSIINYHLNDIKRWKELNKYILAQISQKKLLGEGWGKIVLKSILLRLSG